MAQNTQGVEATKDPKQLRYETASQWQLMWWKFLDHKLAVISTAVVILLLLIAAFAEFVAPQDPYIHRSQFVNAPPQVIRFWDENGFSLRPFVHDYERERDMRTLRTIYTFDTDSRIYLRFFVEGTEYELFSLIPSSVRLFGTESGEPVFLFGADRLGRDLFSRVIYGTRISMTIGFIGVVLSFVLGITIGGLAGYYGGIIDTIVQRIIELLMSIPTIPLWMGLAAAVPRDWSNVQVYFAITIILSLIGWTNLARVVRSQFLSLREEDFVMAAQLMGASKFRVVFLHMLPSFISYVIAAVTLAIPTMILTETALSFLGLGLRPPTISWGVLLQEAQNIRSVALTPWLMIPGLFVVIAVLSLNFVGDGLRDAADPYTQ